jgi:hypothetical protein
MSFRPDQPYNDLPVLPPREDVETKAVLKACIEPRGTRRTQGRRATHPESVGVDQLDSAPGGQGEFRDREYRNIERLLGREVHLRCRSNWNHPKATSFDLLQHETRDERSFFIANIQSSVGQTGAERLFQHPPGLNIRL